MPEFTNAREPSFLDLMECIAAMKDTLFEQQEQIAALQEHVAMLTEGLDQSAPLPILAGAALPIHLHKQAA